MGSRRLARAAVIAALFLPLAAPAEAAEIGEWSLDDAPGDTQVESAGYGVPGRFDSADILRLDIGNESAEKFDMSAQVQALQTPQSGGFLVNRILVWNFRFGNTTFRLQHNENSPRTATLLAQPPGVVGRFHTLNATVDEASRTITIHIPRAVIRNEAGFVFGGGLALTHLVADASLANFSARVYDRAPDVGIAPEFRSRYVATEQRGQLFLSCPEPLRVSNGEATTVVYEVQLANAARDRDERVVLRAENPNPEWQVRVPASIRVPRLSAVRFPVILTMNHSHAHGGAEFFTLVANSTSHPDEGAQLPLGIAWTSVPQPAGHHAQLWLHEKSTQSQRALWMNTLETDPDPAAKDGPAPAYSGGGGAGEFYTQWIVPLQPRLLVGLDFDINRTAHLAVDITPTLQSTKAFVRGTLRHCDPDPQRKGMAGLCAGQVLQIWTVAQGASGARGAQAGQRNRFELELAVNRSADVIPFHNDSALELVVDFVTDIPQASSQVSMHTDTAEFLLPLQEYHDPVVEGLADAGRIQIVRGSPIQRAINPGGHLVFRFVVRNEGNVTDDVLVEVAGLNQKWTDVVGPARLRLASGESSNVTVALEAPSDARPGERADLFLVAQSGSDAAVAALSRFQAVVVDPEAQRIPDEATTPEAAPHRSPAVAPAAFLAALAVATLLRRR